MGWGLNYLVRDTNQLSTDMTKETKAIKNAQGGSKGGTKNIPINGGPGGRVKQYWLLTFFLYNTAAL